MPKLEPKGTPDQKAEQKFWLKGRDKFLTGYCNSINKPAQCEGTKPRSLTGNPMKTCERFFSCPCECHWRVDEMFRITGLERKLVPNPEYQTPVSDFVMPEITEDPVGDVAATSAPVIGHPDDEPPTTAPSAPAVAPLAQRRTETGRAARGGLEAQVWDACFNMPGDDDLTPKQIVEWIAEKYKIPTPSTGAVNAVWERWVKLDFATLGKKPNRFTGFQHEGTWEELVRMKGSAKRQAKSAKTAMRLGRR